MQDWTDRQIEEKIALLFQPDALLAPQYFENFRRKTPLEPEKKLMLAILEDAVWCYRAKRKPIYNIRQGEMSHG
jgi:hypothetical protein